MDCSCSMPVVLKLWVMRPLGALNDPSPESPKANSM